MKVSVTVKRLLDGDWQALALGSEVGNVEIVAPSRALALEKLANEVRYRLEWCPCSAVADDYVQLDVLELQR
jgi:hypothetical protein